MHKRKNSIKNTCITKRVESFAKLQIETLKFSDLSCCCCCYTTFYIWWSYYHFYWNYYCFPRTFGFSHFPCCYLQCDYQKFLLSILLTIALMLITFFFHYCRNPSRMLLVFSSLTFFPKFTTLFCSTLRFHSSKVLQITFSMAWLYCCLFCISPIYQWNSSEASNILYNFKRVQCWDCVILKNIEVQDFHFHLALAARYTNFLSHNF